jgi:hypothetical protein
MTSLTPTLTQPPDDTPVLYALEPGAVLLSLELTLADAEAVADLLEETIWRYHWRSVCQRRGVERG